MPQFGTYNDIFLLSEFNETRQGTAFSVRGRRQASRRFLVWTTNNQYGPNEICSAAGLPSPYDPYLDSTSQDFDEAMVCTEINAFLKDDNKDDKGRWIWVVTCLYSTEVPEEGIPDYTTLGNDPLSSQNQPWKEPPVFRWESEVENHAPQRDRDGRPYVNSAGQPFTPAFTKPAARAVLVIQRNEPDFDPILAQQYAYAVNNDVFYGALPGCAQLYPIHADQQYRGSIGYYRTTYRIRFGRVLGPNELNPLLAQLVPFLSVGVIQLIAGSFNLESFQPYLLDAGLMELRTKHPYTPEKPGLVPILANGPVPVSQPVCLNGNGQWLPPTLVGGKYVIDPVYLYFSEFQPQSFNPIATTGLFGGGP